MCEIDIKNTDKLRNISDLEKFSVEDFTDFNDLEKYFYDSLVMFGVNGVNNCENFAFFNEFHSFLIEKILDIHNTENSDNNRRKYEEFIDIRKAKDELENNKRAYDIYYLNEENSEYYIIGDLHSDSISITNVLSKTDFFRKVFSKEKIKLVFLGDYVDRGQAHIKCLEHILLLKYLFQNNIYILRGNHDGAKLENEKVKLLVGKNEGTTDKDYFMLYLEDVVNKNPSLDRSIIAKYIEFFNSLCSIAFINKSDMIIMCVHGGIPRAKEKEYYSYIHSISDLTNEALLDDIGRTIKHNMLWSDPYEYEEQEKEFKEGTGRFHFKKEHFNDFKAKLGFDLMIRGHEAEKNGFKVFFDETLYTIFSSGKNNETAYDFVKPKFIKLSSQNNHYCLEIESCYS